MANDDKNYKAQEDAERAFYLISACNVMRDFPRTLALASSFIRELHAMNLRQEERDAKDREQQATKEREAQTTKETSEDPRHAPSVARR